VIATMTPLFNHPNFIRALKDTEDIVKRNKRIENRLRGKSALEMIDILPFFHKIYLNCANEGPLVVDSVPKHLEKRYKHLAETTTIAPGKKPSWDLHRAIKKLCKYTAVLEKQPQFSTPGGSTFRFLFHVFNRIIQEIQHYENENNPFEELVCWVTGYQYFCNGRCAASITHLKVRSKLIVHPLDPYYSKPLTLQDIVSNPLQYVVTKDRCMQRVPGEKTKSGKYFHFYKNGQVKTVRSLKREWMGIGHAFSARRTDR